MSESDVNQSRQPAWSLAIAYLVARFGIFVAIAGIAYLIGAELLAAMLIGAIVSIPLSYFLLRPWRDRIADRIAKRQEQNAALRSEFGESKD